MGKGLREMIYLELQGRIGNQLFMYAMARRIQLERGRDEKIIIDDTMVLNLGWDNSLINYDLPDVEYVHNRDLFTLKNFFRQKIAHKLYSKYIRGLDFEAKFRAEKKWQKIFEWCGYIVCENGYLPMNIEKSGNIVVNGFFQSEKYFDEYKDIIRRELDLTNKDLVNSYPGIEQIRNRNSVCISIKVEHNVGSSLYDVCTKQYWEKAIQYIIESVENPLFFICSDNVEYVKENLIDCNKYDAICQDRNSPVEISLAVMSECKHFIIGNTSFGWWAQYLSNSTEKIMIAPTKWMLVDMPVDIYQDDWTLIEV